MAFVFPVLSPGKCRPRHCWGRPQRIRFITGKCTPREHKDHSALPGPLQVASDNQRSRGGRFSLETEKQDEAHKAMTCSIKGEGEPIQLGGKPERIALHWKQRPQGSWLKIIKSLQGHFT